MIAAVLLVVAGLAGLYQGGSALVGGASALARRLGVSPLIVGLTIVAFATSAPEMAVSVIAALRDSTDIAIGNVLGSNIFNTLVAVGLVAFFRPLRVNPIIFRQEIWICLAATGVVGLVSWTGGGISRAEGLVLLELLVDGRRTELGAAPEKAILQTGRGVLVSLRDGFYVDDHRVELDHQGLLECEEGVLVASHPPALYSRSGRCLRTFEESHERGDAQGSG